MMYLVLMQHCCPGRRYVILQQKKNLSGKILLQAECSPPSAPKQKNRYPRGNSNLVSSLCVKKRSKNERVSGLDCNFCSMRGPLGLCDDSDLHLQHVESLLDSTKVPQLIGNPTFHSRLESRIGVMYNIYIFPRPPSTAATGVQRVESLLHSTKVPQLIGNPTFHSRLESRIGVMYNIYIFPRPPSLFLFNAIAVQATPLKTLACILNTIPSRFLVNRSLVFSFPSIHLISRIRASFSSRM